MFEKVDAGLSKESQEKIIKLFNEKWKNQVYKVCGKNDYNIAQQILHEGEIYLKETINVTDTLERKAVIFLSVFLPIAIASIGVSFKVFLDHNLLYSFALLFFMISIALYFDYF